MEKGESSFTQAAYLILKNEGKPLTSLELTHRAIEQGLITTKGKTPSATMWASLYTENRRKSKAGKPLRFKQGKLRVWGLTEWE